MSKILAAGEESLYESMGDTMRVKLEGADTDGQYTLAEDTIQPGFDLPLQLYRHHSKTFYVIDGEITFTIGSQVTRAAPGMTIHVPANMPHAARSDRAGLAIYELAGPAKIQAARIYDDVAPPFD